MFAGQDLYYFKPNVGGQADAWSSQKDIVFISGGNRSGKSTLLCHLAAAYMLPHPEEEEYAYWPCIPDWNAENQFMNEETQLLRATRRVKLPAIVWFSTKNMAAHKDVAMQYFPTLFKGAIAKEEWSDEPGVWTRVILNNGSELHLKSAAQGLAGFQRANIDLMVNDEPFANQLYGEQLARLLDRRGRMVIGATAITSVTDPKAYRESEWLIETFAEPAARGDLPPNVAAISIPLTENPHVDINYAKDMYAQLPDNERRARMDGEMISMQGECFFNRNMIKELKEHVRPPEIGILEEIEGELLYSPSYDTGKQFVLRVWEYPDEYANYSIGIDPSSGGVDPSVIRIWCDEPRQLVAEGRGWLSEDMLPRELSNICHWYGRPNEGRKRYPNVMVVIETNQGRLTLASMQYGNTELGVTEPLPMIYFRPKPAELSRGRHFPGDQPGFQTTSSSRGHLLSAAQEMLIYAARSENEVMACENTLDDDYYWFVWDNGKPQAKRGFHDDRVIADGLAWLGFKQRPFKEEFYQEEVEQESVFIAKDNTFAFNPFAAIEDELSTTGEVEGVVYG